MSFHWKCANNDSHSVSISVAIKHYLCMVQKWLQLQWHVFLALVYDNSLRGVSWWSGSHNLDQAHCQLLSWNAFRCCVSICMMSPFHATHTQTQTHTDTQTQTQTHTHTHTRAHTQARSLNISISACLAERFHALAACCNNQRCVSPEHKTWFCPSNYLREIWSWIVHQIVDHVLHVFAETR